MEIIQKRLDEALQLCLSGRLDATSAIAAEDELNSILNQGNTRLILDFEDLGYISSAGLRILLKLAKNIQQVKGLLIMCNMKDYIRDVFDVSGFSTILKVVQNLDEAKLMIKQEG